MKARKANLASRRQAAASSNWTVNLGVLPKAERAEWSKTLEKDAQDLKKASLPKASVLFETGHAPVDTPTVQLQKLLIKAGKAAGVVLPKKLVVEVDKEPHLVESFQHVVNL